MKNSLLFLIISFSFITGFASKVEVKTTETGFQLLKDGKPYYIKGGGGTVELEKLKSYGGNSIRTWGIDAKTDEILDEAHKNGITVTFGIWMGQERQGFDYSNEGAIKAQLEEFRRVVRKYKDHPAILLWGVGNEMDLDYTNFDVWEYLEQLCQMIHEEDPNHPTMAVTAGLDVAEIKLINKHTPSLDILGVNTYGDISYLPKAIKVYGWKKPYIVAEWGPYGWWEVAKTKWGASIEETSSQKAETYSKSMKAIESDKNNCLGSYVFLWGQKQEHTSTWFGLFTEEGDETEVMDVLIKSWSNEDPKNFAPSISNFRLNNKISSDNITVQKNSPMTASVEIVDKDNDPLKYEWLIIPESTDKKTGGDAERVPKALKGIIKKSNQKKNKIEFNAPEKGEYRLFLFVHDGNGNVATGNIPFKTN
ncbi:hypothetical protein N9544_03945 [Flavobacteriales bacterium]|nr:hypothetical protein [Flavobacteriales bacterium]